MDDNELDYDPLDPKLVAARDEIGKAISAYVQLIHPEEAPFVTAWMVGAEWTNSQLERSGRAVREVIAPQEQTISATAGLGAYVSRTMLD